MTASTPLVCVFFNDTATTEIYPLSLHDALPISPRREAGPITRAVHRGGPGREIGQAFEDQIAHVASHRLADQRREERVRLAGGGDDEGVAPGARRRLAAPDGEDSDQHRDGGCTRGHGRSSGGRREAGGYTVRGGAEAESRGPAPQSVGESPHHRSISGRSIRLGSFWSLE